MKRQNIIFSQPKQTYGFFIYHVVEYKKNIHIITSILTLSLVEVLKESQKPPEQTLFFTGLHIFLCS